MGASNTPLYDLVELQGLLSNTTYTTAPGGGGDIIGYVDNATYTDSEGGNSATQITEINETTDSDNGRLFIDGMEYSIEIYTPSNTSNPVTVTYNDGASTIDLTGDDGTSEVAFLVAQPLGPGSVRWFMAIDDSVGDLPDITSIQIRNLDTDPAGDDVKINLDQDNDVFVCFVAGTSIETVNGPRPVETIRQGDLVLTYDHGPREVLWARTRTLPLDNARRAQKNAPVRIHRGALGPGMPVRDLLVSPQHRLLIASKVAARMFGAPEILVPATRLVKMPGILRERRLERVTYCHLFFGAHELIWAEGAVTESLLPERGALAGLTAGTAPRIAAQPPVAPARPIVENGPQVRELLRRHRKNVKPLVAPRLLRSPEKARAPLRLAASR